MVKERLGSTEEVCTPDTVLAELSKKYVREGVELGAVKERLSKISEISRIIPIDKNIAIKAAEVDRELRDKAKRAGLREPSLVDVTIPATARALNASLITGDQHFEGEPETTRIGGG